MSECQHQNDVRAEHIPLRIEIEGMPDQTILINEGTLTVGSHESCSIVLGSEVAQPVQFILIRNSAGTIIRNCHEETKLNGNPVGDAWVHPGDKISVGHIELKINSNSSSTGAAEVSDNFETNTPNPANSGHVTGEHRAEPVPVPQETSDVESRSQQILDLIERLGSLEGELEKMRESSSQLEKKADSLERRVAEKNEDIERLAQLNAALQTKFESEEDESQQVPNEAFDSENFQTTGPEVIDNPLEVIELIDQARSSELQDFQNAVDEPNSNSVDSAQEFPTISENESSENSFESNSIDADSSNTDSWNAEIQKEFFNEFDDLKPSEELTSAQESDAFAQELEVISQESEKVELEDTSNEPNIVENGYPELDQFDPPTELDQSNDISDAIDFSESTQSETVATHQESSNAAFDETPEEEPGFAIDDVVQSLPNEIIEPEPTSEPDVDVQDHSNEVIEPENSFESDDVVQSLPTEIIEPEMTSEPDADVQDHSNEVIEPEYFFESDDVVQSLPTEIIEPEMTSEPDADVQDHSNEVSEPEPPTESAEIEFNFELAESNFAGPFAELEDEEEFSNETEISESDAAHQELEFTESSLPETDSFVSEPEAFDSEPETREPEAFDSEPESFGAETESFEEEKEEEPTDDTFDSFYQTIDQTEVDNPYAKETSLDENSESPFDQTIEDSVSDQVEQNNEPVSQSLLNDFEQAAGETFSEIYNQSPEVDDSTESSVAGFEVKEEQESAFDQSDFTPLQPLDEQGNDRSDESNNTETSSEPVAEEQYSEDSYIQEYMKKLLGSGAEQEIPLSPLVEKKKDETESQESTEPKQPEETVEQVPTLLEKTFEQEIKERQELLKPSEFVPKSSAPEKNSNLQAMRELANQSARSAIETSSRKKKFEQQSMLVLIGSGVSFFIGASLALLAGSVLSVMSFASLIFFVGTGFGAWYYLEMKNGAENTQDNSEGDAPENTENVAEVTLSPLDDIEPKPTQD